MRLKKVGGWTVLCRPLWMEAVTGSAGEDVCWSWVDLGPRAVQPRAGRLSFVVAFPVCHFVVPAGLAWAVVKRTLFKGMG